jgi:tRNA pseudouridine55 synthase
MILLVDKPAGMTSQQVVSKIKRAMGRKLKIGHTGTLDPMCTGLLPVLTDGDTKLTQFLPHKKAYLATIRFGVKTDTGDVTGSLLTGKTFIPHSDTGKVVLPDSTLGGRCEITTDTGDIRITVDG